MARFGRSFPIQPIILNRGTLGAPQSAAPSLAVCAWTVAAVVAVVGALGPNPLRPVASTQSLGPLATLALSVSASLPRVSAHASALTSLGATVTGVGAQGRLGAGAVAVANTLSVSASLPRVSAHASALTTLGLVSSTGIGARSPWLPGAVLAYVAYTAPTALAVAMWQSRAVDILVGFAYYQWRLEGRSARSEITARVRTLGARARLLLATFTARQGP